jgi:hypothetical protein
MFSKCCPVIISGISAVIRRRGLIVKAQVQSWMNLYEISGGLNGT